VEDLFRFDQALYTEDLVSAETMTRAFERFRLKDGRREPYGYGWITRSEVNEPKLVWHGGVGGGYLTSFHRELGAQNTVIILSNSSAHHLTIDDFASAILDILHDRDYRQPRIPISHPIASKVFDDSAEAATALYRQLRDTAQATYLFNEHELNFLGYQLMWAGRDEEAILILELNAEEYPDSANAFDSLGDVHREAGNTQRSIENYERALRLDSNLKHTRRKLNELSGSIVN
jgi:tetratricopeptide (TPR) repeat protein